MSGLTRGPRRTDHAYDKTDLLLLGGGAVLVLIGLALAADSWFAPRGSSPAPSSGLVASADSARQRFLRRDGPADSAARADSANAPLPVGDSTITIPSFTPSGAAVASAPSMATAGTSNTPRTPSVASGQLNAAPAAPAPAPEPSVPAAAVRPAAPAPNPTTLPNSAPAGTAVPSPAATTAAPRRPLTSAVAGEPGSWSVQAGAFGSRENADRLAASIGALGFRTTVVQTGTLHRVRAIGFASQRAADSARQTIATVAGSTLVVLPPAQ